MARLVDVGLPPCSGGGLVGAGLDPLDVHLAPLSRVPRQLSGMLDVGGEVAEILRFLSVRQIRGRFEHFGADDQAGGEALGLARLHLALVLLGALRVAVDERCAHHSRVGARLQHLDVIPVAQLLADAALSIAGSLVFVTERDGRLVRAGDVAHLGLLPPGRLVDGREFGPGRDSLRVELRLQLTCFLEVAAGGSLRGVHPCLGR